MYAMIKDGVVIGIEPQIFEAPEGVGFAEAPEGCNIGWMVVNGVLVSPVDAMPESERSALKLAQLREYRNVLLGSTDYLALSDNTLTPEMAAYRQALRDITKTYTSIDEAVFPEKP